MVKLLLILPPLKIAHQTHGAIGFTKEHDLYLYFRYAKVGEITLGDATFHKEVVAREMDLGEV